MGIICNKCQHENNDNANFCSVCGNTLTKSNLDVYINKSKKMGSAYEKMMIGTGIIMAMIIVLSIISGSLAGIFFALIIGIPILISFSINLLINNSSSNSTYKINDKSNIDNNKKD